MQCVTEVFVADAGDWCVQLAAGTEVMVTSSDSVCLTDTQTVSVSHSQSPVTASPVTTSIMYVNMYIITTSTHNHFDDRICSFVWLSC